MSKKIVTLNKSWGHEKIIANNESYCLKMLIAVRKFWSSKGLFHWHKIKDETLFVIEGSLLLHILKGSKIEPIVLEKDCSYRIKPGVKHKFSALSDTCHIIELSNAYPEVDIYKEEPK